MQKLPDYVESVIFAAGENLKPLDVRTNKITALDERALIPVSAEPGARKVFGCYYSSGCCQRVPLQVKLRKNRPYRLAVYFADCDKGGRDYIVEVFDLQSMNRISPCTRISDLNGGVYVVFELNSSVQIMASNIRGDNSLMNAVFFDSKHKTK